MIKVSKVAIAEARPNEYSAKAVWYAANYYWCSGKKDNVLATSKDPIFLETHQLRQRLQAKTQAPTPADVKVTDLAVLLKHAVPGLDLAAIEDLHRSYLQEHEGFLGAGPSDLPEVKVIDAKSAERVNALSAQFQKALAQRVGPEAYRKLTGRGPSETIDLIDSRIVQAVQRSTTRR